jgi:hypothetical protein
MSYYYGCVDFSSAALVSPRYWVGGTGTWNTSTTNWSTTSGGSGGASVPTASNDVIFDNNSGGGTVTRTVSTTTRNFNSTGFTGAFAGTGALTVVGSMIWGASTRGTFTGTITMTSTSSVDIRMNGNTLAAALSFNASGGAWTLTDALTNSSTITVTQGTLNTNDQTVSASTLTKGGSGSLILGASAISVGTWSATTGAGTITANTSVITVSGATFLGGGFTYNEVDLEINGTVTMTGANTFNVLRRLNSAVYSSFIITSSITVNTLMQVLGFNNSTARMFMTTASATIVPITITCGSTNPILSNVDIQGITASGFTPWTGSSLGDMGSNSNITLSSPVTVYCVAGGTVANYASNIWSTTSGGSPGAPMPLPQDFLTIDGNSFTSGGGIECGGYRVGNLNFTNATNNPTISNTSTGTIYAGSLVLIAGMTAVGNETATFQGSAGSRFLDMAGIAYPGAITINLTGSSDLDIATEFTSTEALTWTQGIVNQNAALTISALTIPSSSSTWTKNGNITLTGTGQVFDVPTPNTFTDQSGTITLTNTSSTTKIVGLTGKSYNNIEFSTGSAGAVELFSSGATVNNFKCDPGAFITFESDTLNFSTMTCNGTSGNLITFSGTSTLVSANGTPVACTYMDISNSTASGATFTATLSTDGGGNTGWTIT